MTAKSENEWVYMEVREHYFYVKYKPNTILDIDAAKKIINDTVFLADGKVYPCLCDISDMPQHHKDVQVYFAKEGSKFSLANAIIVSNSLSKILANLFIIISKPIIPTKIFTDISKATKWLEMFPKTEKKVLV
jgi:hypothetical protein